MNKNKLSFKVLLDNHNAASFTGAQYNASYYVDFKKLIVNDEDLDKSYYVYVTFKTMGNFVTSNAISNENLFLLNIDFNKGSNIIQYATPSRTYKSNIFILPIVDSLERGVASNQVFTYFDMKDSDYRPMVVNNIRSINTIKLQVIEADTYDIFNPSLAYLSKYTCILTFVEM